MNSRIDTLPGGGFVQLVSYTQPVDHNLDHRDPSNWTGDLEIVRNARVSHKADWRTGKDAGADEKLLNYMYKNNHTSPFESMVFTFEVQAPIFIFRQWHRHRTWSYNEVSARYAKLDLGCYVPHPTTVGIQSTTDKQSRDIARGQDSSNYDNDDILASTLIAEGHEEAYARYERLLEMKVPREIARSVLTLNAYSRMFGTVNLHNLFKFLELRLTPHAQYEIRVYGDAMLNLIEPIVPIAVAAFKERQRNNHE